MLMSPPPQMPPPCEAPAFVAPVSFRTLAGVWQGRTFAYDATSAPKGGHSFEQTYTVDGARFEASATYTETDGTPRSTRVAGHFSCDGALHLTQGLPKGVTVTGLSTPSRVVFEVSGAGLRAVETLSLVNSGFVVSSEQVLNQGALSALKFGSMRRVSADPGLPREPVGNGTPPPYDVPECKHDAFVAPPRVRAYTGLWDGDIATFDARTGALLRKGRTEGNTTIRQAKYHLDYTFILADGQRVNYVNPGHFSCDGLLWFENFALTGIAWEKGHHLFQERTSRADASEVSFDTISLLPGEGPDAPERTLRTTHRTAHGELVEVLFLQETKRRE